VLALTLGSVGVVAWRAGGLPRPGAADLAALRFTLVQAALSAALSVALAVPVARALARRRFAGRGALITALGAPFLMPVIVAVAGLLAVFGRAGPISAALQAAGLAPLSIYGLHGVVLAHVYLNLPLAVRLILQGWQRVPSERLRLAAALDFGPAEMRAHVERPMLRAVLPGAFVAIFAICLTSFAVALTMGGGPRASTLELAIYQAFRFEFDLGHAAALGLMQVGLCAGAALALFAVRAPAGMGAGLDRAHTAPAPRGAAQRLDVAWIAAAAAFLMLPLVAVALRGAVALAAMPAGLAATLAAAALRSAAVAGAATALCIAAALALALAAARAPAPRARAIEAVGMLPLAASPLVIGTALYLALFPLADPVALALPVTALVNAALALPFALRALIPAARAAEADFGRLADSLGMTGAARLRHFVLPRLRAPLGFAAGLAAALSMGDLGVIALFADPDRATLPMVVHHLMGAYRTEAAAGAALLLLVLSFAAFRAFDLWGRADADA